MGKSNLFLLSFSLKTSFFPKFSPTKLKKLHVNTFSSNFKEAQKD
ncbi:hypothetical protein HMPREF9393_1169 [Streptococcus sanguinis SK1056]|uniref:Uncharacterized protein n=1 Tax=Streptococcus sanguinis SK1056 TaxID=888820 RepID=F3UC16_STRSA|nr:hypothetical protein HMPREF9393_1169 [Streptococcus sanguinis SK1056]